MALRPFMTQGVVPQTLLNSFTAGNAPQGGVAMTAPMTPRTMAAPAAPAPAATQGPDSLAEMTRLLSGDLSGSLSSGDKLLALSGLLRSATRSGRRAGITPQQVIGQLQQQKLAELQNRMAVEQMRAQAATEKAQRDARDEFINRLPTEEQRAEARLLPLSAFGEIAKERLIAQTQTQSAQIKEYEDRVRKFGKAEADRWLALQDEKFISVTEGGEVIRASDFFGSGGALGAPAPSGVTFSPINTAPTQGGPASSAPGQFR
jgi:hypothetical protein